MMDFEFVTSQVVTEEEIQMLVPPVRPIITTSEDFRRYLKQLNQYY